MNRYYKQSNNFSFAGFLLTGLSVSLAGILLSMIYILVVGICPVIYLNILLACGLGLLLGFIAGKIVKVFKMRSTPITIFAVVIGLLLSTYFKWAFYDFYDFNKLFKELDKQSASEYVDFTDFENFDSYSELKEEYSENAFEYMSGITEFSGENLSDYFSAEEIAEMKDETMYEYYDYDELLGTDSKKAEKKFNEIQEDIKNDISAKEFYEKYYPDDFKSTSLASILLHPARLVSDIIDINSQGRWSIGHSYSSHSDENNNVKGIMLWLVWLGELLCIWIPALMFTKQKSDMPFIENDDNWAEAVFSGGFRYNSSFTNPKDTKNLKSDMENNPDMLFNLGRFYDDPKLSRQPYLNVTLFHSINFEENYISIDYYYYNQKEKKYFRKNVFEYMSVSQDFVHTLYEYSGMPMPEPLKTGKSFNPNLNTYAQQGYTNQQDTGMMDSIEVPDIENFYSEDKK